MNDEHRNLASDLLGGPLRPEELESDYVVRDAPLDLDTIRRMLDDGTLIPPWIVRGLVERCEQAKADATVLREVIEWFLSESDWRFFHFANTPPPAAIDASDRYHPRLTIEGACLSFLALLAAARAWDDAVERCDGIVAAEARLREAVRGL